ncbi:MAG: hypothetical protein AW08_03423 [Candidatus Accumulibacter adjunctus]|uniref:Uncharacterized protein n=1 Tax=Candidatus Accumulibacter adjunctus TaxID=1454001 RepID=A0A011MRD3_9PROT|nr:MAG: hypothetical protein AW08_03423 [Candidatus Accumulibacter adjunctus]
MHGDHLECDDAGQCQPELAVGEELAIEGGAELGPGIEDVEELEQDEGGEGQRHGVGVAAAAARAGVGTPGVGGERTGRHRQAVEAQAPEARATQDVGVGCAGRALHDARSRRLDAERHRRRAVHDDVDPEDLDRGEGCRQAEQRRAEHGEDGPDVGGQLEADELDDVVVDRPAFLDRPHDAGEIVVGQHHGGGFAGDIGSGDAHGDADVGGLQRRCIVDAVAGHGDDLATRLQRFDDAQLVLGRDAGEDGRRCDHLAQRRTGDALDLAAFTRLAAQAEVARDGGGGCAVVAGDHFHGNAGSLADPDGLLRLRPRRVDDADQGDQRQIVGPAHQVTGRVEIAGGNAPAGQREHAHRAVGEGGVGGAEGGAGGVVHGHLAVRREVSVGACQQHVGRALDPHAHDGALAVEGGHELVRRVEGDFGDARAASGQILEVHATLRRQRQQRALGRVADQLAIVNPAVGAQRRRCQQWQPVG